MNLACELVRVRDNDRARLHDLTALNVVPFIPEAGERYLITVIRCVHCLFALSKILIYPVLSLFL